MKLASEIGRIRVRMMSWRAWVGAEDRAVLGVQAEAVGAVGEDGEADELGDHRPALDQRPPGSAALAPGPSAERQRTSAQAAVMPSANWKA